MVRMVGEKPSVALFLVAQKLRPRGYKSTTRKGQPLAGVLYFELITDLWLIMGVSFLGFNVAGVRNGREGTWGGGVQAQLLPVTGHVFKMNLPGECMFSSQSLSYSTLVLVGGWVGR